MKKSQEIWLPVAGYEGLYEISNLGSIKRVACAVERSHGRVLSIKEKILKGSLQPHGYYTVALSKVNKKDKKYIHRLVAEHFIPNPEKKKTVNHVDGIKTNNRAKNLEWATYQENNVHAFNAGLNSTIGSRLLGKKGELCHNYRRLNKKVSANGVEYDCVSDAAKGLNLSEGYLYQCLCGSVANKPEIKYI